MSGFDTCSVCSAENLEELEGLGKLALAGEISWREAERRGELNHYRKLKVHMEKHYVAPVQAKLESFEEEMAAEVLETKRLLLEKARMSPPEVRPMYLAAIHNLEHLREMKASQAIMVQALKTATEMTGMKMEQQLMLQYAAAAFGATPKALEEGDDADILDVDGEEVDLSTFAPLEVSAQ